MIEFKVKFDDGKFSTNNYIGFESLDDLSSRIKNIIDYLESHNKNYTREQYYRILFLLNTFDCFEFGVD